MIYGVAIAMNEAMTLFFCSLSFHVLLYLPLIETTLILNESLVYEWKIQQHIRRQTKVLFEMQWEMLEIGNPKCCEMSTQNVIECE